MYVFISMIILSIVTYIPRVIPLLINKQIESTYIKSILYYMPYCVLSAMTFPAILYSTENFMASFVGAIVGVFLAYKERSLVQVALTSVLTVYIINIFMRNV